MDVKWKFRNAGRSFKARIHGMLVLSLLSTTVLLTAAFPTNEFLNTSSLFPQEVRLSGAVQISETLAPKAVANAITNPPPFLKTTGILEAWKLINHEVTSVIAIVDTGVDFNHPTLKPYLLEGRNLLNARVPPQDDNGHGTSVAGIIVTIATASEGDTAKWKGKILPIKALDKSGMGDEAKLTQGIRYAVDQGADIVVLSLGLRRDAPNLREAVNYAESKGVLLVAASGNDAAQFGSKAAIQYPAAYPTVLAVAGSDGTKPNSQSTSGPENDISAAWKVHTLSLGGGTIEAEGTSMGAPQVAAVAAMIKAEHPDWSPLLIREAIRQSAVREGTNGWTKQMGYGFLSASRAIQAKAAGDWREPNDLRNQASEFPIGTEVHASWTNEMDQDWYTFDSPYDGVYTIYSNITGITLYDEAKALLPLPNQKPGEQKQWTVKKGRHWLQISRAALQTATAPEYRLVSSFRMSADLREPNDSSAMAYTLPARSQQWVGNFHQQSDEDWFVLTLTKPGMLKITITPDTTRMDPELRVQPAGGTTILIDDKGDGGNEQWTMKDAKAGKYFIRITNAVASKPEPVIGTYIASVEYITEEGDSFEPNNGPLTSTPLSVDKVYYGIMNSSKDQDWYKFTLTKKQKIKLSLARNDAPNVLFVELQDKKLQTLKKWNKKVGQMVLFGEMTLNPGTYYVKVTPDKIVDKLGYGMRLRYINS